MFENSTLQRSIIDQILEEKPRIKKLRAKIPKKKTNGKNTTEKNQGKIKPIQPIFIFVKIGFIELLFIGSDLTVNVVVNC